MRTICLIMFVLLTSCQSTKDESAKLANELKKTQDEIAQLKYQHQTLLNNQKYLRQMLQDLKAQTAKKEVVVSKEEPIKETEALSVKIPDSKENLNNFQSRLLYLDKIAAQYNSKNANLVDETLINETDRLFDDKRLLMRKTPPFGGF